MSERIYAWLLRLYPAEFRAQYGEDAFKLFRDRAHNERGAIARMRLWMDLIADLAVSVPREYGRQRTVVALGGGVPSFHSLSDGLPRASAVLLGGILSLAAGVALSMVSSYTIPEVPIVRSIVLHRVAAQQDFDLDAAERQRVIQAVIASLEQYYVDPAAARKIADLLAAHAKAGDYDNQTDGRGFAGMLTQDIRSVNQDQHLIVVFSADVLPNRPPPPSRQPPSVSAVYRENMKRMNCTIESVETLPHNIGYLKLNSFPDPSVCGQAVREAMAKLNQSDALIFDLRDNRGGIPDMVSLIAAYLFDHPEYLYNPREITTERSWTRSPVAGNNLADKHVFLLTSVRTASGAEQFTYDLKMLKRATLVGETTSGQAHAGMFHRIDDHFGMGIPEVKPINPFSKADWEGVGVEPDVKVRAEDALAAAQRLAKR